MPRTRRFKRRSTASITSPWCERTATSPAATMTAGSRQRDPKAKALLGPENSLPHDYTVPQAYRTAIPEELYATSFIGDRAQAFLTGPRCRRTVLPDGVVPRSAPSLQPARQVLGYVQARAVSSAGGIFAQRLDAAAAHSQRHRRARSRQGQSRRHEHDRCVGARGAGGEGADLRHDRLHRRCHWWRARRARSQRHAAKTPW